MLRLLYLSKIIKILIIPIQINLIILKELFRIVTICLEPVFHGLLFKFIDNLTATENLVKLAKMFQHLSNNIIHFHTGRHHI